jgi:hypothetical protein
MAMRWKVGRICLGLKFRMCWPALAKFSSLARRCDVIAAIADATSRAPTGPIISRERRDMRSSILHAGNCSTARECCRRLLDRREPVCLNAFRVGEVFRGRDYGRLRGAIGSAVNFDIHSEYIGEDRRQYWTHATPNPAQLSRIVRQI